MVVKKLITNLNGLFSGRINADSLGSDVELANQGRVIGEFNLGDLKIRNVNFRTVKNVVQLPSG